MRLILVAAILAGCGSTGLVLHDGARPDSAGPCLQLVHPGRRVYDIYKGQARVGSESRSTLETAVADRAPAAEQLRHADRLERDGIVIDVAGVGTGIATIGAAELSHHDAIGDAGVAIGFAAFVIAGIVFLHSHRVEDAAVDDYNRQGCPP